MQTDEKSRGKTMRVGATLAPKKGAFARADGPRTGCTTSCLSSAGWWDGTACNTYSAGQIAAGTINNGVASDWQCNSAGNFEADGVSACKCSAGFTLTGGSCVADGPTCPVGVPQAMCSPVFGAQVDGGNCRCDACANCWWMTDTGLKCANPQPANSIPCGSNARIPFLTCPVGTRLDSSALTCVSCNLGINYQDVGGHANTACKLCPTDYLTCPIGAAPTCPPVKPYLDTRGAIPLCSADPVEYQCSDFANPANNTECNSISGSGSKSIDGNTKECHCERWNGTAGVGFYINKSTGTMGCYSSTQSSTTHGSCGKVFGCPGCSW